MRVYLFRHLGIVPVFSGIAVCKGNTFFRIRNSFSEKNLLVEELVLKNKQIDYGYRDVGIRQIEDRSEEVVVAVDQKPQQPRHTVPLEQREVEHVDDLPHHEPGVMASELRDGVGRRFGENQPVEGAVEDVAHGSGEDQRQPDDHAFGRFRAFPDQVQEQPSDESDHHDAEESQKQFAPVEAAAGVDVHAECGSVVLDEPQLEPVGADRDRLVEVHVGLDPDFERLIRNEQQDDEQRYFFQIHESMRVDHAQK